MKNRDKHAKTPVFAHIAGPGAGSASAARAGLPAWRAVLLGTVAAGALMLAHDNAALAEPGDCDTSVPGVATCTGDHSQGIVGATVAPADFSTVFAGTININNLTADIAPPESAFGGIVISGGGFTVNSDTTDGPNGPVQIISAADGIALIGADISIDHTGNIVAGDNGIRVIALSGPLGEGDGAVDFTGNITADGIGIIVQASNSAQVTSVGDISSATSRGIVITSNALTAEVSSTGNITSYGTGININGDDSVQVTSVGDILSETARGIDASGDIATVSSTGDITAATDGIFANGSNGVEVTSTGDILVTGNAIGANGIQARSSGGTTTVSSMGNITAFDNAIDAIGQQGLQVTSIGDIASEAGIGIEAISGSGNVEVSSTGDITANNTGIYADAQDAVEITSVGNVSATTAYGIRAYSASGTVDISSTGNITADRDGIVSLSSQAVQVTSTGNVTSQSSQGIDVVSQNGTADVVSTGNVSSALGGITARGELGASVESDGHVTAGTIGILVDSAADVDITTSGGTVDGGDVGVFLNSDTAAVTVNNLADGTITGGTLAIDSESATGTTVNNAGTVTGDVALVNGGGNNLFDNLGGGLFNSGASVDLGAGGSLRNAGTLSPGGVGTVATTAVTGSVTQTGAGVFEVDVNQAAGTADRVNVTETAELDGTVRVELQNVAAGEHSNVILSAAGGTTDNGLDVLASPILQASLTFPNATDVVLTTLLDFTPDDVGLNDNQEEVGDNLGDIFDATGGDGAMGPLFDALINGIFSISDYLDALNQLIPEIYLNTETASLFAAEEFNGNMLSCPEAGFGLTAITQGECLWLRYDGRWLDRDGTRDNIGFEEDAHGISGGGQVAVARDWTLGFAAAYEDSRIDTDTNASADADRYMIGGVVKYQSGPALLALAGSFGTGEYDVARRISFGGFNATPRSSFDVHHAGATLHAAYLMDRNSWYAKPFVDLNVTHIDREAAQERGGGAANLNVSGSKQTYFSVTPALELGATIDRGDGYGLRPYVRAGVTFYADTDQSLQARFAAAPASVGSFRTRSEFDDVHADVEAGLTVFHGEFGTMSAGYEARFGDDNDVHGFFVKGTRKF